LIYSEITAAPTSDHSEQIPSIAAEIGLTRIIHEIFMNNPAFLYDFPGRLVSFGMVKIDETDGA
jgi:hypothetical protein